MTGDGLTVVVTGATGNVGAALVRALLADPGVREVVGVARRLPAATPPGTRWIAADVAADDLVPHMRGADAVVHLAWEIQPSHDLARLERTNVTGSRRVFEATVTAGVPILVHASSVGVYSPGPKDRRVGEDHPREGVATSFYGRHKAAAEHALDAVEAAAPGTRVVRMRPGLVFRRGAASRVARLFLGPRVPRGLVRPGRLPLVPAIPGLAVQAVHGDDLAQAYVAAIRREVHGAFNVAAAPVLDPGVMARALGSRTVPVPAAAARAAVWATWNARLQVTAPGWLDLALQTPLMDVTRARRELGWEPRHSAVEALREIAAGIADGAGEPTPPLAPAA